MVDLGASSSALIAPVIARTKLVPPRLRPEIVERSELIDRWLESSARLTVVSGPAGSGKSTLLAQFCSPERGFAWLSVGRSDNDPVVLLWTLIESIRTVLTGFGGDYRDRLLVAGPVVVDEVVAAMANELERRGRPLYLFVDDVQLLTNPTCREHLHRFVGLLPSGVRMTIASRESTPLPLARLRVEGDLLELTAADLALTIEEASELLARLGTELRPSELHALVARMDGWAAGLRLAFMAASDAPDRSSFVEQLRGTDRDISSYLIAEVLDRASATDREFMIDTSVLTRLSGELCDFVTGRADGNTVLRRLERSNSFVIALDRNDTWFRYHHLYRELLFTELHDRRPDHARLLHARAFRWLRDQGSVLLAIDHAFEAGLLREAADLFCEHWFELVESGRVVSAQALLDRFDDEQVAAYQPLAVAGAFLSGFAGDQRGARRYLRAAEGGSFEGRPPDGAASIESSLALARGSLAFDGVDAALADATRSYELEPIDGPWRRVAALVVGLALAMRGDRRASTPYFEEAAQTEGSVFVYARAELALDHLVHGEVDRASGIAESACSIIETRGYEDLFFAATAFAARAMCALEVGDDRTARVMLRAATRPMEAAGTAFPMDLMHTSLLLARVALTLGEFRLARRYVDAARRTDEMVADTGTMGEDLVLIREQLRVVETSEPQVSGAVEPLTDREKEIIGLLSTKLTNQEIGEELFLSRNTIKTYLRRIYRKLGASSRAEALLIARERELGVSPGKSPG